MKRFTWMCAMVVPCFTAAALFAADYTIAITVDANGGISYGHAATGTNPKHGGNGHQAAGTGETITWQCATGNRCSAVSVQFKNNSPCQGNANPNANENLTTCKVTASDLMKVFPYSIAVSWDKGKGVTVDDPDVIVDNGATIGSQGKGTKKK